MTAESSATSPEAIRHRILESSRSLTEAQAREFLGHEPDHDRTLALWDPATGFQYPAYQFNRAHGNVKLAPVIARLLEACQHNHYRLAAWLVAPHADFHGRPPHRWLYSDPPRVVVSFRASLEPQTHG